MKIFLDSDVIIDFLTNRNPFGVDAKMIFQLNEEEQIDIYTSAVALSNVNYIIGTLESEKIALVKTKKLLKLLRICQIGQTTVDKAASSKFNDFEDALQNFSALESNINILITRNIKDYKKSELSILTPKEFHAKHANRFEH